MVNATRLNATKRHSLSVRFKCLKQKWMGRGGKGKRQNESVEQCGWLSSDLKTARQTRWFNNSNRTRLNAGSASIHLHSDAGAWNREGTVRGWKIMRENEAVEQARWKTSDLKPARHTRWFNNSNRTRLNAGIASIHLHSVAGAWNREGKWRGWKIKRENEAVEQAGWKTSQLKTTLHARLLNNSNVTILNAGTASIHSLSVASAWEGEGERGQERERERMRKWKIVAVNRKHFYCAREFNSRKSETCKCERHGEWNTVVCWRGKPSLSVGYKCLKQNGEGTRGKEKNTDWEEGPGNVSGLDVHMEKLLKATVSASHQPICHEN